MIIVLSRYQIEFTMVPYRGTDLYILSSVDEIQVLLEDHIIRMMTMLSSAFIKPLEAITTWVFDAFKS